MGVIVRILSFFKLRFNTIESQILFKRKLFQVLSYFKYVWYLLKLINMHILLSWYLLGVPKRQLHLISSIEDYVYQMFNVFDKKLISDNMYYSLCMYGKYAKTCCPEYLKKENYETLQKNVNNVHLFDSTFNDVLSRQMYTKCILMDHMDWLSEDQHITLCELLMMHIENGGKYC